MKSYILCGLTATVVLVSAGSAKAAVVLQATYGLGESGSYTTGNSNYAPLVDTLNGHNIKTGLNLTNTQGTSAQTATIITTGLSSGATAAGSTAALQISNNAARAGGVL